MAGSNPLFQHLFTLLSTSPFTCFNTKLADNQIDAVLLGFVCAILKNREWEAQQFHGDGRQSSIADLVPLWCLPTDTEDRDCR